MSLISFPGESFSVFPSLYRCLSHCAPPTQPLNPPPAPDIYSTHFPLKLPNIEDSYEDLDDAVEQAFDMDYDVAQAFCSYILPKAVLLFTGEALNDGIYFELEDGEGDNDDDKTEDNEV